MPVRSLNSPVFRWPDQQVVDESIRSLATELKKANPEVERLGYIGSYARGNWGVGSDVDVLMIVSRARHPFMERASAFDLTRLPVPADLMIYTTDEWERLLQEGSRFARTAEAEGVWVMP